jgi:hypothetical protein
LDVTGQEDRRTLLVLTNKDQQWQARYFERQKEDGRLIWKEIQFPSRGLKHYGKRYTKMMCFI